MTSENLHQNEERKRKVYDLIKKREALLKDQSLRNFVPHPLQREFLLRPEGTVVAIGSNKSGKTEILTVDAIIRSTGVIPKAIEKEYPKQYIREGEYWISALAFHQTWDVNLRKFNRFCPNSVQKNFNQERKVQYLKNGSEIGFKSAEQGADKYQGSSKVYAGHDEEPSKAVRDEARMRLIDYNGIERFSFTPLKGFTWAYTELFKRAGLYIYSKNKHNIPEGIGLVHTLEEIEKLRDREVVYVKNSSPDADPNIVVIQMTLYDNPHLPVTKVHDTEKEHQHDPAQYNSRILGNFAKATGNEIFNVKKLEQDKSKCPHIFKNGEVENGQFRVSTRGRLTVFRPLDKITGNRYVIGADISEGLPEGDYSCAQILDHRTGEQVAVWHGKVPTEEFARILNNIGRWFNNAYLAPESNFLGKGVISLLREKYKYSRLYFASNKATEVVKGKNQTKITKEFGWRTDQNTKPLMITHLSEDINSNRVMLNDVNTIEELTTYISLGSQKMGAAGGCTDDRVVALAIANQVRRNRALPTESRPVYYPNQ